MDEEALAAAPRERYYATMARTDASVGVQVQIPAEFLGGVDVFQLGAELRLLWVVEQVRRRKLGVGKAAEIADMSRAAFMRLLGEHGIPVIDYPLDDLQEELGFLETR